MEVAESLSEPGTITVVEWGESIKDVLPSSRIVITINYLPDEGRTVEIQLPESAGYLNDTMD